MPKSLQLSSPPQLSLLGEHHPLVQQLGSAEGLHELSRISRSLRGAPVTDFSSLRGFLQAYQNRVLLPVELPVIHQAYLHAGGQRTRELVELDRKIGGIPALQTFLGASRRVGQNELRRLKPLRDVRVLQRYLAEVESGAADGWHTLVFGLTLAVYSVPLRQGLLGYAQQVSRGFIQTAGMRFPITLGDIEELEQELSSVLVTSLGSLLFLECMERAPH